MTLRIKDLKGKFPEKLPRHHVCSATYSDGFNEACDSYAELEVGLDDEKLADVIYRVSGMKGIATALTKEISAHLSEILVIGTTNKKGE